jgi:hypothetical protein
MSNAQNSNQVFEQEFLPMRAKLLEVAASLDRIDRTGDSLASDSRRLQIQSAIHVLSRPDDDRAEKIQLIFSHPYEENWRENFRMTNGE